MSNKKSSSFFLHPSSFMDDNVTIGEGTKIWHFCHIHSGANIGSKCSLGQNVNVGNNVKIGNGVKIQNNVSVYEGVELEDYVFCGPSMVFTNDLTPRAKYPKGKEAYKKTLVKYGASIGANATIVCGNTVGRWAMIASGAVVTKDVVDYALVAGIPAKQIGWACECGSVLKDNAKEPSLRQVVTERSRSTPTTESIVYDSRILGCDDCNRKYKLEDNKLVQI